MFTGSVCVYVSRNACAIPFRYIDPILRETALLTFRDIILFRLDAIINHFCFLLRRTLRGLHIRSADEWLKNAQHSAYFTKLVTDFWVNKKGHARGTAFRV